MIKYDSYPDVNGRLITEGDIVGISLSAKHLYKVIHWNEKLYLKYIKGFTGLAAELNNDIIDMMKLKVLGNVYDNPDMLK